MKLPPTQTENIRSHVACCDVALARSTVHLASAIVVADVVTTCRLIAVAADHLALKGTRLVNALDSLLGLAHNCDFLAIDARVVELARKTLGLESVARNVRRTAVGPSISKQRPGLEILLWNISNVVDQVCFASVDTRNYAFVREDRVISVSTRRVPQDAGYISGQLHLCNQKGSENAVLAKISTRRL